jgi:uncharacterized protein YjiS (DUF1127 family)
MRLRRSLVDTRTQRTVHRLSHGGYRRLPLYAGTNKEQTMDHVFHFRRSAGAGPGAFAALRERLRRMGSQLAAAWRYAAARREFERLDAAALRDLGLGPSEFESCWAEAHGAAERSRRRVDSDGDGH